LVEKPSREDAPSNLAVAARYVFRSTIFEFLDRTAAGKGNEIQLTDAIDSMIREGGRVLGVSLADGERRFDIGNFSGYFRAFFEFALEDPEFGSELREFVRQWTAGDEAS
jgi:UTP--glucose-1-phosphate uridylyltransferase